MFRLAKLACPYVNDDQKIDVDDQKWNSGRPHHDYWILESLFYKILFICSIFLLSSKYDILHLRTTTNTCGDQYLHLTRPLTTRNLVEFS